MNSSQHIESKSMEHEEKCYDLTVTISDKLVVFPGDPSFESKEVSSLDKGSLYHLCQLSLGNHMGTHIDYPSHVIKDGKTSANFSLENLMGAGLIIEVPDSEKSITSDFVKKQSIFKNDIVFFKTSNSQVSKYENFYEKYVYIEPEAAEELLAKGVKIVGIDYLSVDKYDSDLPVHKSLLSRDVLIVEGLELNNAPIGRCKIFIMPLKINEKDGLPARVMAMK